MAKRKQLLGYRLHKERVIFSGRVIIRTIKFPLVPLDKTNPQSQILLTNLKKAIISDDLRVRGDLNLNDYINYSYKNNSPYTLFNFYLDSLKAGVIWAPSSSGLIDCIDTLYQLKTSPINKIWENADQKIKDFFDKELFREIIISDPLRKGKKVANFKTELINCLKNEYKEENSKEKSRCTSKEAENLIDYIVEKFFDKNGNLILNGEEQKNFWKEKFKLDKDLLEKAKPKNNLKDITFFIAPELIVDDFSKELSPEDLISKRKEWLINERKINKNDVNGRLEIILGLRSNLNNRSGGGNFNGFSNYYNVILRFLQQDKIDEIYKALTIVFPISFNYEKEIRKALEFLSIGAKRLGTPSLSEVSSWADYRSVFGGKLKSWFTNYQKREKDIDQQKKALKKAKERIFSKDLKIKDSKEAIDYLNQIKLIFQRLDDFLNKEGEGLKFEKNYQIFRILHSDLKRKLNLFYQNYVIKDLDKEQAVDEMPEFEGIFKKIYKPVAFFGDSTMKVNKKIVQQTIPILENGIELINELFGQLKQSFNPKDKEDEKEKERLPGEVNYRKLLNFIFDKYFSNSINSSVFKEKYEQILKNTLVNPQWSGISRDNFSRYTFYKNSYARGTQKELEIKSDNFLGAYKNLVLDLVYFLEGFSKDQLLKDKNLLLDWIEMAKVIIGKLLSASDREKFSLDKLNIKEFDFAYKYKQVFSLNEVDKNEFAFFIQSLIFSEIRGAATLFSKKTIIVKYTVQAIRSNDKFPLFYQLLTDKINLKDIDLESNQAELINQPHHYLIAINKIASKKNNNPNLIKLDKEDKKNKQKVYLSISDENFLKLSSSYYQIQFLDRILYKPSSWRDLEIIMSEWSFIVEKEYEIDWDLANKIIRLKPIEKSKKNKLYLSIPFSISTKSALKPMAKMTKVLEDPINYPILGIDVGEYGIAYCLVNVNDNQIQIKEVNFFHDKNIANIKDKFAQIQQRARQGIFDERDNVVARVRENAIGHLRNKIHRVLTKNQSSVIYEFSITNFETGSNRTIKIYDSVKRADVKVNTDADRQIHNHIWGKDANGRRGNNQQLIGRHLSAYASSYTCAKCHRSFYQFNKEDINEALIVKKEGNILEIKLKDATILRGFSQDKKYKNESEIFLKKSDKDLKIFRKLVSDFARPPLSKNSEVITKFAPQLLKDDFINKFRKKRGNSAIFICPFSDCHFIADCDIQAAFMMAIRGFLNFKKIVETPNKNKQLTKTAGESYLKETINLLKKTHFSSFCFFKPH